MTSSSSSSALLPDLISQLFQQTYFGKTVTTLFDQIEPLFLEYTSKTKEASSTTTTNLLWARILFHIVSLAGQDASQQLLEKSLNASRTCLIALSSSSSPSNNKNNKNRLTLNFMIREVTAKLYPGVRVVLSSASSTFCREESLRRFKKVEEMAGKPQDGKR